MLLQRARATRLLLMAITSVSACSRPTEIPVEFPPKFTALITGGVNHTVRGSAHFSADAVSNAYGFTIMLAEPVAPDSADRVRHAIYLYRAQPGGPKAGEFRVIESGDAPGAGAADFVGGVVLDANTNNAMVCRTDTGTVRLTPGANGRLLGTFAISARCGRVNGPGTDDPIQVTGSFEAEVGAVVFPDISPPSLGSYTLAEVAGQPLPGVVSIGVDEGQWYEVIATAGRIAIGPTGHYEQTVALEGRTDGNLTSRWKWVDRGSCGSRFGAHLICTSEYLQNVSFDVIVKSSALEISQAVAGDGVVTRFRYGRGDSP